MQRTEGARQQGGITHDPGHDPVPSRPLHQDTTATGMAACGYWRRRGLRTEPEQVAVAPGARMLLLAVLAAAGGGVLLPRPSPAWHADQARLLGRPVRTVPVPAECGGVPDPVALLESVRRARDAGGRPHVLILSVADSCTGTAVPPELLHEVCEAAADEGLLIVSDETWRDASHRPHDEVIVGPAEMQPVGAPRAAGAAVVIAGVGEALPQMQARAGVARFPATQDGRVLGDEVRGVLAALRSVLPSDVDAAVAEVLAEPEQLRLRRAAEAGAHGTRLAALHDAFTDAGALCRPPRVGRSLYADLEPVRPRLAAHGIAGAPALEAELTRRIGPYAAGGHRFGDDPRALRVCVSGDVLLGGPSDPETLGAVRAVLGELTAGPR